MYVVGDSPSYMVEYCVRVFQNVANILSDMQRITLCFVSCFSPGVFDEPRASGARGPCGACSFAEDSGANGSVCTLLQG